MKCRINHEYNNNPIGMIDSGLGGLSLFKHIRQALPNEDIFILQTQNTCLMATEKVTGLFHEPRI